MLNVAHPDYPGWQIRRLLAAWPLSLSVSRLARLSSWKTSLQPRLATGEQGSSPGGSDNRINSVNHAQRSCGSDNSTRKHVSFIHQFAKCVFCWLQLTWALRGLCWWPFISPDGGTLPRWRQIACSTSEQLSTRQLTILLWAMQEMQLNRFMTISCIYDCRYVKVSSGLLIPLRTLVMSVISLGIWRGGHLQFKNIWTWYFTYSSIFRLNILKYVFYKQKCNDL